MLTVRTFDDLLAETQALTGVTFSSIEIPRIISLMNRRAKKAYHATNYWPRYLVIGEARTATNSTLAWTNDVGINTGVFMRVHGTQPFVSSSAQELRFAVTPAGAVLTAGNAALTSAYVTYKVDFSLIITSTSVSIPGEWLSYIAYGVYADWLRSEGFQDKAAIADMQADDVLADELQLISDMDTVGVIGKRIFTAGNTSYR